LVGISIDLSNQVQHAEDVRAPGDRGRRACLRGKGACRALEGRPEVANIVEPSLAAWRAVRGQIAVLDRTLIAAVRADPTCRLLMTCPGVGTAVAPNVGCGSALPLGLITEEQFNDIFSRNVKGVLFAVQKALPL
jgi:transposase